MRISLSGIAGDSIVDGPGIRLAIFTQGCPHHCPGCHNPQTHDPAGGYWGDTDDITAAMAENPLLDGITLSGGEPFLQPVSCHALAKEAHRLGLNVWAYTGYTWEDLLAQNDAERMALLHETDVLVDGPFLLAERSLNLRFKGSRNQRTIDVRKSLGAGTIVLWGDGEDDSSTFHLPEH